MGCFYAFNGRNSKFCVVKECSCELYAAAPAGYGIPAGAKIVTPSPADQDAAKALLKAQWPAIAGN